MMLGSTQPLPSPDTRLSCITRRECGQGTAGGGLPLLSSAQKMRRHRTSGAGQASGQRPCRSPRQPQNQKAGAGTGLLQLSGTPRPARYPLWRLAPPLVLAPPRDAIRAEPAASSETSRCVRACASSELLPRPPGPPSGACAARLGPGCAPLPLP